MKVLYGRMGSLAGRGYSVELMRGDTRLGYWDRIPDSALNTRPWIPEYSTGAAALFKRLLKKANRQANWLGYFDSGSRKSSLIRHSLLIKLLFLDGDNLIGSNKWI